VFSAHSRDDAAKTAPPTVTLTLDEPSDQEPPLVTLPDEDNAGLGGIAPPIGTGFAPAPTVEVSPAIPTAASPPIVSPVPVALPRAIPVGYAYPQVWLLPVVFLVLIPLAGSALTRDLTPYS
jgi:hypothetical protein